ncbi:MAG: RagB/SusD family nutrient uptake outer membrane protein [Bacteroidales bacterium]|nr:RagB/SusD family nutrient uptake outer membrane protein [Bacteroidales bacterium]
MKNHKITLLQKTIILGIIVLFSACDYLNVVPDKNATVEYAFGERIRAIGYLATCYSFLPSTYAEAHPGRTAGPESFQFKRTDNEYPIGYRLLVNGNNKEAPYMNYWDGANGVSSDKNMFKAIRCCDLFLDNINSVPNMEIWEKVLWSAEVKFLKAYYHWWLMLHYGPIPTIRKSLPLEATPEESMVYRDPMDETMEYIIELIDEAIPDLYDTETDGPTGGMGRITKIVAMAMKAKILTFYASPFFNGNNNPNFANFTDSRGVKLFPEKNPEKWVKAMDACWEAIDQIEKNVLRYNLYQDLFENELTLSDSMRYMLAMQVVMTTPVNNEQIWSVYPAASSLNQDCFPIMDVTTGNTVQRRAWCPTLWSVEQFWSANGVPIEEDREWSDNGWYKDRYRTNRGDDRHAKFIVEFEETAQLHFNREYRFYGSVGFDRARWYGAQTTDFNENNQAVLRMRFTPDGATQVTELNGKRSNERFFITGYCGRKIFPYLDKLIGSTRTANSYPWCDMRLADLYLLYAEARNEVLSAPDGVVYEYIDRVRARVGLPGVEISWRNSSLNPSKHTTQKGMREIIQQERVNELMYEGHLYYDIRRWSCNDYDGKYDILKLNNMLVRGWNIDGATADDFYVLRTIKQLSFSERELLWPIRESSLIQNSHLVQNPGW